jgi:hypothetical protein
MVTNIGDELGTLIPEDTRQAAKRFARGPKGRGPAASLVRACKAEGLKITPAARILMNLYVAHACLGRSGQGLNPWARDAARTIGNTLEQTAEKHEVTEFLEWLDDVEQKLAAVGLLERESRD